jgi:phosphohistidine phosphatase
MRQLLILRHAKSSWDDPSQPDHARPLNERGRQAVALMQKAMQRMRLVPELILVSSSRRTLQTLQALQPFVPPPKIEPLDALYLASSDDLIAVLRQVAVTTESVLLIGHNPGLHDLAGRLDETTSPVAPLARLREAFPTGALAEFAIANAWSDLGYGSGILRRFITPRDLLGPQN